MKFKKKPEIVEAIQYTGYNKEDVCIFAKIPIVNNIDYIMIQEPYSNEICNVGDWVVRKVIANQEEFYVYSDESFKELYEQI